MFSDIPDNKVQGANMGPIWGRQVPGGPHVGPMSFAIWNVYDAGLCEGRLGCVEGQPWIRWNTLVLLTWIEIM